MMISRHDIHIEKNQYNGGFTIKEYEPYAGVSFAALLFIIAMPIVTFWLIYFSGYANDTPELIKYGAFILPVITYFISYRYSFDAIGGYFINFALFMLLSHIVTLLRAEGPLLWGYVLVTYTVSTVPYFLTTLAMWLSIKIVGN